MLYFLKLCYCFPASHKGYPRHHRLFALSKLRGSTYSVLGLNKGPF